MKICQNCKGEYTGTGLKYCGSIEDKSGCAWILRQQKRRVYNRISARKCYALNPEKFRLRSKVARSKWGDVEKQRKAQHDRNYRARYRDEQKARNRRYYLMVREARKVKDKLYLQTHREEVYLRNRARYYKKKAVGSFRPREWLKVVELYGKVCAACGLRAKLTIDHKIPIACGGMNTIDNLQPLCLPCNQRKHTTTALAALWLPTRTPYLAQYRQTIMDSGQVVYTQTA